MRRVLPARVDRCIPIKLGKGPSKKGPRIGGRAPEGIAPRLSGANTQYLLTMPLLYDPSVEFSVYLSVNDDEIVDNERRVHAPGLEVIAHSVSARSDSDSFVSSLSPHPLLLGPEADDTMDSDGEKIIETSAKLGGRPFMINPEIDLEAALNELGERGFVHVLQMPSPSDARVIMAGQWPFGGGMLHLFARPPFESAEWSWYWEL